MKEYKIYKIMNEESQIIYIGSTTNTLIKRKYLHDYQAKLPNIKSCKMVLIQTTNDKSREDFWIDYYKSMGCLLFNKNRAVKDNSVNKKVKKEKTEEQKLKIKQYLKRYCFENKEQRRDNKNKWYSKNKDKVKEYVLKNKENIKEYQKEYQKQYYLNKKNIKR